MRNVLVSRRLRGSASALALATAVLAAPQVAAAATCIWNGGTGTYTTSGDWSCGAIPGSADDVQVLVAGSVVNLVGGSNHAGTLDLGAGNQFNLNAGADFFVDNHAVTNNGVITIANASRFISGSGTVTVDGTGAIVLDDTTNYAQITNGGFVFGSGQTVRGSGGLGVNNTLVTNNGLINADVSGGNLFIDVAGGNGSLGGGGVGTGGNSGLFNTGTMQADNSTLTFQGGRYENSAAGVIKAINSGTVALANDSRIIGGTLTSDGASTIAATGGTRYLQNVTLSSGTRLNVTTGADLQVNGGIVNNGTITIANAARMFNETG
ncbi:MAG: hypothetical protein ABI376_07535, partial [Caulobacteraceae bacterium]